MRRDALHGIVIKLSTHFYAQRIGCSNLMHQMFQKLKGHCNTLHGKKTFPICRQCCHKHASELLFHSRETTISHKGSLALSCCIQGALYYIPPMTSQNCAIDASDCVIVQIVHDPEILLTESLCTCAKLPIFWQIGKWCLLRHSAHPVIIPLLLSTPMSVANVEKLP